MTDTITRPGAILPVEIRTARKQHACDDCPLPIEPGDKYELSASPPHRIQEYDVDRWLTWRTHYPRHDGHAFLRGCDEAAAYAEKAARDALPDRTDPGYLRRCVRTDCAATYNALDVMDGRASAEGWRMFRSVIIGTICPDHAAPVISQAHAPKWLFGHVQRVVGIGCTCQWEWRPRKPDTTQGEHQQQWVAHLISVDQPAPDGGTTT